MARLLYEIGMLATRIVEIMDDLREADGVFLPMVVLAAEQRRARL